MKTIKYLAFFLLILSTYAKATPIILYFDLTNRNGSMTFWAGKKTTLVKIFDKSREVYRFKGFIFETGLSNSDEKRYFVNLKGKDGQTLRGRLRPETRWIRENYAEKLYIFEGKISNPRLINQAKSRFQFECVIDNIFTD